MNPNPNSESNSNLSGLTSVQPTSSAQRGSRGTPKTRDLRFLNLHDFEAAARRRLPRAIYEYISYGSQDGVSLAANRAVFDKVRMLPRVMQDTSRRTTACRVMGTEWSAPFGIAPMGVMGVAAFRADLLMARVCLEERIPFVLSGSSLFSLERVAAVNPQTWFQMYPSQDDGENQRLLQRVWASGLCTLVVTVDVPVGGNRENDLRNGYSSPLRPSVKLALDALLHPRWLAGTFGRTLLREGLPHFENFAAGRAPMFALKATRVHRRDTLDWNWLRSVRDKWAGKLLLKGVLSPLDAQAAAAIGIDAVIVSNHGGRQLDTASPPLRVLPEMAMQAGAMELLYDSGVRRGADVIKAVGLGARMALVGRPFIFAAAAAGEEGVRRAVTLLKSEIHRDLALLGSCGMDDLAGRLAVDFPLERTCFRPSAS